jgi:hypothetical protein
MKTASFYFPINEDKMKESNCKSALRELIASYGYSIFWRDVKELNRERVSKDRPKREHFPKSMYQKLFDKQRGNCHVCNSTLDVPATLNHIDHINPHEGETFNAFSNLQLLHRHCNLSKSSKSLEQMSKQDGKTFVQQLTREAVDPNEL